VSRLAALRRIRLARFATRPNITLAVAGLLALTAALIPSRARALDSDGLCVATGIIFCYRMEIGNGPFGPELRAFFPLWTVVDGGGWGW
jgi:hypothetical protein